MGAMVIDCKMGTDTHKASQRLVLIHDLKGNIIGRSQVPVNLPSVPVVPNIKKGKQLVHLSVESWGLKY